LSKYARKVYGIVFLRKGACSFLGTCADSIPICQGGINSSGEAFGGAIRECHTAPKSLHQVP
jgi:hypothetical protein